MRETKMLILGVFIITLSINVFRKIDVDASCTTWYNKDGGIPNDILPCPPYLFQTQQDDRFEPDAAGYLMKKFHPGADYSFRQKIPSPSKAGQQCTYKDGSLLIGPPGGGTADRYSPNSNKILHFTHDVIPWFKCCKFPRDKSLCQKYYEKRPSDSGLLYSK